MLIRSIVSDMDFYSISKEKYIETGRRLYSYYSLLSDMKRGSITHKTKGDNTYYYLTYRDGKTVKTDYIGNADDSVCLVEAELKKRKQLEEDIKKTIDEREACEHALTYKGWCLAGKYDFSLYYDDLLVADVFSDENEVHINRYEKSPGMQLFYKDEMTRYELGEILESRCWDSHRENIDAYLGRLKLNNYDPYEICKRTHGIMLQDLFWMKFLGEKFDGRRLLRRCNLV